MIIEIYFRVEGREEDTGWRGRVWVMSGEETVKDEEMKEMERELEEKYKGV
jgi:hypothetical protein